MWVTILPAKWSPGAWLCCTVMTHLQISMETNINFFTQVLFSSMQDRITLANLQVSCPLLNGPGIWEATGGTEKTGTLQSMDHQGGSSACTLDVHQGKKTESHKEHRLYARYQARVVQPWEIYCASPSLSFLLCKVEMKQKSRLQEAAAKPDGLTLMPNA